MEITIGRIVLYTLTEQDAEEVNRRRTTGTKIHERIQTDKWPLGAQAHIGNSVSAGEVYPLVVTKVWSAGCVNGQVLLDGNDCLWATSATEGTTGHCWHWPTKV
jgi:hypothetical protein